MGGGELVLQYVALDHGSLRFEGLLHRRGVKNQIHSYDTDHKQAWRPCKWGENLHRMPQRGGDIRVASKSYQNKRRS